MGKLRLALATASLVALVLPPAEATSISVGTPTTTVPSSLSDPLNSLASFPGADEFLLPIEITGASSLQDWSFDLLFDSAVVNPKDAGGLYQSVYQSEFNATDITLSNITSSGFAFAGMLQGVAGFSSGVSGDGLLAYILFEYADPSHSGDPGFAIDNPVVQQAPEPATLALLASGLLLLGIARVTRRGRSSAV